MPWLRSWHGAWYGSVPVRAPKPVSSRPSSCRWTRNSLMSQVASATARGVGVVHVEHLAVLGLQGVGARGGCAHDGVAGPRERGQRGHVAPRPPARDGVPAVADERQPAAHLGRHDDLEAVALQDGHGRRRDVRLVVVRRAAVEVDDGLVGTGQAGLRRVDRQRPVGRPPGRGEGAPCEGGQGGLAMDTQHHLHRPAGQVGLQHQVGQRREAYPQAADEVGLAEQPVADAVAPAQRARPLHLAHDGPGAAVDLGDLDVGRAG